MAPSIAIQAQDAVPAEADERAEENGADDGVYLPSDRQRQRQLDRAERLLQDRRWSDAATLLDDILAADNDSFHRVPLRVAPKQGAAAGGKNQRGAAEGDESTWKSLKATASDLIASMDAEGRAAYELQFRARAERALGKAVADGDSAGVVDVARRWFHTPAGGEAAMLLALESLEGGQPFAAVAWLDHLRSSSHAASFEPTLSVMRAIAWRRAGDGPRAIAALEDARKNRRVDFRMAGRNLTVSYPSGGAEAWLAQLDGESRPHGGPMASEWLVHGGNPARNASFDGFRPLLAPRYRVSLARHPEEARTLERHRRTMAEQDVALLPAGQPLAVSGRLIMRSTLGLLAVDFETGKRVWMQPGPYGSADDAPSEGEQGGEQQRSNDRVFEDATSGTLSSDGRLVFVVENPRQAYALVDMPAAFRNPQNPMASGAANTLSAYEVGGSGRLAWRLSGRPDNEPEREPQAGRQQDGRQQDGAPRPEASAVRPQGGWFTGIPLPVGGQLFAMVEEKGSIRLDVMEAASGRVLWSQPLAELDDSRAIDKASGRERRFAGLSPSLAEGVLVCPTGAGAVVAVDLAARALLWAYRYPVAAAEGTVVNGGFGINVVGPGGVIIRRGANGMVMVQGGAAMVPPKNRWVDGTPILADGRVVVSPRESDELHCLDQRTGRLLWKTRRKQGLYVAGVVDGRVIVVGRNSVDALSLDRGGERVWNEAVSLGTANPSGRGCIARGRLLVPTDTPEVVEIDLARGAIVGRSAGRGGNGNAANGGGGPGTGVMPGNLIAYRGEVVSQAVGSLDVFHQTEPLEKAVETALTTNARDPWALYWKGQVLLDRGRIAEGIASVQASHAADPARIPGGMVADTILFALERDFPAAASLWSKGVSLADVPSMKTAILRTAVDGFLKADAPADAWSAYRRLAFEVPAGDAAAMIVDPRDPSLVCTDDRWMRGRLQEIVGKSSSEELRGEIDAATQRLLDEAVQAEEPLTALPRFLERSDVAVAPVPRGGEPASQDHRESPSLRARRLLCERLAAVAGSAAASEVARGRALGRELLLLSMARSDDPEIRSLAGQFFPPVVSPGQGSPGQEASRQQEPHAGPAVGSDARRDEAAWPVGRVTAKRDDRHARGNGGMNGQNNRFVRIVPVPCENDPGPDGARLGLPNLRLSYDVQNGSTVIASDGFGRRLGDPLVFEEGPARFGLFGAAQSSHFDASVVGRVAVVRCGGSVAAFEVDGHAPSGRNRRLWSMSGPHGVVVSNTRAGGNGNGIRRNGAMPLGMRVVEPAGDVPGLVSVQIGRATTAGVPVLVNQSLELRDVLTGTTLWTRYRVPPGCDFVGDERFLTVIPRDGKNAMVLSMTDGRVVRRCDLPSREVRLCSSGRRIVTIENTDGSSSGAVRLAILDPATGQRESLGEFPADARASTVGADELAVLDPRGRLTLLSLSKSSPIFSRTLDQMPGSLEGFHVLPWRDRLMLVAARQETTEERQEIERGGTISSLPQAWNSDEANPIMTASIWSLDRATGESLWPMPATVLRHGLQLGQPGDLPVLVFARQIHSKRGEDRPRLGLLCIDKRTGHEVFVDDRIPLEHNMLSTCEITGNPTTDRIALDVGTDRVELTFDGTPIPPRPPYQAAGGAVGGKDVWREVEKWMNRALQAFPF